MCNQTYWTWNTFKPPSITHTHTHVYTIHTHPIFSGLALFNIQYMQCIVYTYHLIVAIIVCQLFPVNYTTHTCWMWYNMLPHFHITSTMSSSSSFFPSFCVVEKLNERALLSWICLAWLCFFFLHVYNTYIYTSNTYCICMQMAILYICICFNALCMLFMYNTGSGTWIIVFA